MPCTEQSKQRSKNGGRWRSVVLASWRQSISTLSPGLKTWSTIHVYWFVWRGVISCVHTHTKVLGFRQVITAQSTSSSAKVVEPGLGKHPKNVPDSNLNFIILFNRNNRTLILWLYFFWHFSYIYVVIIQIDRWNWIKSWKFIVIISLL